MGPHRIASLSLAIVAGCSPTVRPAASLDPDLVALAARTGTLGGVLLRTDDQGRVIKIGVYHLDAAEIPAWARREAEARWPGAKLRSYESEWYSDAGAVFEVEVETVAGEHCELSLDAGQRERYVECEVALDAVPPSVRRTAEQTVPGAAIREVETRKGPGIDEFTVELDLAGREHYLHIDPDGRLRAHLVRLPTLLEVPVP
jgi:hypothetical protein